MKLEHQPTPCGIEDVRAIVLDEQTWSVDANGYPGDQVIDDQLSYPEVARYSCMNCDREFADRMLVLEHLRQQEAGR